MVRVRRLELECDFLVTELSPNSLLSRLPLVVRLPMPRKSGDPTVRGRGGKPRGGSHRGSSSGHRGRHGGGSRMTDYSIRPDSAIDQSKDQEDEDTNSDSELRPIKFCNSSS